jgi:DNA-binding MarR family transcriptional regulator
MSEARDRLAVQSGQEEPVEEFPFDVSVGYQVRTTHRLLQRLLQTHIEPHGLSLGTWYFLRALWAEDGLTQRELSRRIGTMEPTTMSALRALEAGGLIERVRNETDRRKLHVFLTPKGRALKRTLLPIARRVVGIAVTGLSEREVTLLLDLLQAVSANVRRQLAEDAEEPG